MKLIKNLTFLLSLILASHSSLASYENIEREVCANILSALPTHAREVRLPRHPDYPLLFSANKYTWTDKTCSIINQTSKDHQININITGKDESGKDAGINAKVSCLFTSDYQWTCLYKEISHTIFYELHFIDYGRQHRGLSPSYQFILDQATNATNRYL